MMNSNEFQEWAEKLILSEEAVTEIQRIRQSPPSRRVGGGKHNVSGRYSSKKMGVTIQFESHKVELPTIYMLEFNDNVLEYYDQPPQIKIYYYQSKNNKKMAYMKTADFFVIEKDKAYWIECKTEEELIKLSQKNPERYFNREGQWVFDPGKSYAAEFNLDFQVRSSSEINWKLLRNLEFLEDYIVKEHVPSEWKINRIKEFIQVNQGSTLKELIQSAGDEFTADDIYALVAKNIIYIDLYNDLISEFEIVKVYLNKEQYKGFTVVEKTIRNKKITHKIELKSGNRILWGDTNWTILNYDSINKIIFLISENDNKAQELPLEILESYISAGYIQGIDKNDSNGNAEVKKIISQANEKDLEDANKKFDTVTKYIKGEELEAINVSERTIRNWVKSYKDAEELYGIGYVGLIPQKKKRGNKKSKIPLESIELMNKVITESYETVKNKSAMQVYRELQVIGEELNIFVPSYATFCEKIKNRPKFEVEKARKGDRAAYKYEELYTELEFTTKKHGERIFEIAHIDHTELDIELVINGKVSKRPWLTLMIDAFSRRILSFYLTFEEPSYRSCMMVIRECVKRYNRLPNYIVVDGGKEFGSIYFESLLALNGVHKKERPAAKARYGNVIERLFGIANKLLIHNLKGNTQITKNVRQVTKSVNPKNHAVWTLETLNERLDSWISNIYDNMENPSLNQTPKEAFEESIVMSGNRSNTYIPYDETFILMTLPSPKAKTRKVHPGQGIKLSYSYYWSEKFRNPKIENTSVEVKYDPFNLGVAYAFIDNQWEECLSEQYKYLEGKTEKQIKLIAEEIRQKNKLYSQKHSITAKMIASYILESEEIEEKLIIEKYKPIQTNLTVIENNTIFKPEEDMIENSNLKDEEEDYELEIFGELD
ncbi:TnsA endonuclease N-terminal domain-containing protein [Lysinibacillus pakistanensis]|uniref:DDE-type integrase/transposase/recombinase n=1 Tax=Lysinibacillus pakistanensis TaxID=759811 RepID=A0AAX3WV52_9BACI|nr:TnsA endonuclease N-terminal domain-containing protein [Lysinibacillus pakistanensis]MDM5230201.1 DDE-type integrase/transposase/recombinase [Lysinibacillus pakistanensis]WHY45791.1 DDE-type integrase/transposase/recombinase [Lysinibacillus pakistanensis]WHY50803.1 DDE-type integrase/transposase/recombinase [Lysinibacillus pakistanensis]